MKKGSQQQQQQQYQPPQQMQLSPQMGPSGDDYLRMDVIHEEDESNAAKLSVMHLDPLTFELTGLVVHDTNLLNQAQIKLRQHIETKAIPRQLARYQFEQFKDKLDSFIQQQASVTAANDDDLEQIWKVCHDANILQSIMQEVYGDATQTEVNIDSRYELQCSQLDFLKKKSSEQIQKRSYTKINQLNPILVPMDIDNSGTSKSMNSQDINNVNNSALKVSSGSRFRVPSIAAEAENNQNILSAANVQINDKIMNSKDQQQDDSKSLPAAEMQIISPRLFNSGDASNKPADSTSCGSVSNEYCLHGNNQNWQQINNNGYLINHPKIFQIKQNSFQSFRISPKEGSIGGGNVNINVSQLSLADDGQEKSEKIMQTTPITPEDKTTGLFGEFQYENNVILEGQKIDNIPNKSYQLQSHLPYEEPYQEIIGNVLQINPQIQKQEEQLNQVITVDPIINSQQIAQNLIQDLEKDFKEIELLFDDKLVDNVEKARLILKDKIQAAKINQSEEILKELEQFERKHEKSLKYYEDIYKQLHESLGIVEQKEGWRMEGDKHGFMIQYKYIPNSKLIALRLETTAIDMEIQKLLAIIYEIELYTQWFPFCKYAKNIKTVDKARKVVHVKVDPPFVSDREVFIHGIGIDRLNEDGSIVIMARSIHKDPSCLEDCQVTLPKNIKGVLVDIPFFTFQVKPISKDKLRFTSLTNFDAHLKFIPDSIVNLVTRKFARFLFEKMLDQQKKFKGSKYEQNIKDNPQFYLWIEQKCKEFFEKQQNLSGQVQK